MVRSPQENASHDLRRGLRTRRLFDRLVILVEVHEPGGGSPLCVPCLRPAHAPRGQSSLVVADRVSPETSFRFGDPRCPIPARAKVQAIAPMPHADASRVHPGRPSRESLPTSTAPLASLDRDLLRKAVTRVRTRVFLDSISVFLEGGRRFERTPRASGTAVKQGGPSGRDEARCDHGQHDRAGQSNRGTGPGPTRDTRIHTHTGAPPHHARDLTRGGWPESVDPDPGDPATPSTGR